VSCALVLAGVRQPLIDAVLDDAAAAVGSSSALSGRAAAPPPAAAGASTLPTTTIVAMALGTALGLAACVAIAGMAYARRKRRAAAQAGRDEARAQQVSGWGPEKQGCWHAWWGEQGQMCCSTC
jgi:hypothetical protein